MNGPGVSIGRSGASIGRVTYTPTDYWPHNACLYVTDFLGNSPRFVYYFLKTRDFTSLNSGAAQPSLNRNFVHAVPVRIPDPQAQERIATVLGAYDDLIENNKKRIALLEEAALLLYREWFVHLRFPGHEHVKVVDGVPAGWSRQPLGSVLNLQRGFDLPLASRATGDIPVYGSTGVVGQHAVPRVTHPTLVTGRSGSLGTVCYVDAPCWPLNTALWVTEFKSVSIYVAYYMLIEMNLAKFNGGASVPTLDRKVAHAAPVIVPSLHLLRAFDEQVALIFRQKRLLELQNQKLTEARELLLPRLMSGEIAV